jgi:isopenicillin N synthase-like dioxygenase
MSAAVEGPGLAGEVRRACQGMVFFHVRKHGIGQAVIDGVFEQMRRFSALPLEERMKIRHAGAARHRGQPSRPG